MFPPRSILLLLGVLFLGRFAFAQTTVNSTWVGQGPLQYQYFYSDPNNWSQAVVPNNTATTHYNVTIGHFVQVDLDATISNLSLGGSAPSLNIWGATLTVMGQTMSSLQTATITVGARESHGARFNAGTLSTFSNGTLSGSYDVDSIGYPAQYPTALQFNGADIKTLVNGHVSLIGAFAR